MYVCTMFHEMMSQPRWGIRDVCVLAIGDLYGIISFFFEFLLTVSTKITCMVRD